VAEKAADKAADKPADKLAGFAVRFEPQLR
jgi:hypothetical protein